MVAIVLPILFILTLKFGLKKRSNIKIDEINIGTSFTVDIFRYIDNTIKASITVNMNNNKKSDCIINKNEWEFKNVNMNFSLYVNFNIKKLFKEYIMISYCRYYLVQTKDFSAKAKNKITRLNLLFNTKVCLRALKQLDIK